MEGKTISFVTYPDGKVSNASLTVSGRQIAKEKIIAEWLPERYFGAGLRGYEADHLWNSMREKGFKCWTIQFSDDGTPELIEH